MRLKRYNDIFKSFELKPINELFVHTEDRNDLEGKRFIVYKKDAWIFDMNDWEENELWEEINDAIGEEVLPEDFENAMIEIRDHHQYILAGHIEDEKIMLDGTSNYRHASTSTDLKKLSKALDMEISVSYYKGKYNEDSGEIDDKLADSLKDAYFYHGTSLEYLRGISKLGIKPMDGRTNYDNIEHSGKIFITTNLERALFHANTASLNTNSFPVILKFKLPDPSKLILDYDLGIDFIGVDNETNKKLGYSGIVDDSNLSTQYKGRLLKDSEKIDISKKLGVYGYEGRIPASHIEDVFIDIPTLQNNWFMFDDNMEHTLNYESEIWDEFDDVDMWTELSFREVFNKIDEIEDDYHEQQRQWDEEE